MSYFTRQKTPLVSRRSTTTKSARLTESVQKSFNPSQPRDEAGRWVAVSFNSRSHSVEYVRDQEVGGKMLSKSLGVSGQKFKTRGEAQLYAKMLNEGNVKMSSAYLRARNSMGV